MKDGFYKSAYRIEGLVADLPTKNSKQHKKVKVGDKRRCISRKDFPWIFSFVGEVKKIDAYSVMVKIISTHVEDVHLVNVYRGRTIVPMEIIGVLKT